MPLVCVGLNHASAPLDVRGRLALSPGHRRELLVATWFREGARTVGLEEVAILSTCNRTELYAAAVTPSVRLSSLPDQVVSIFARACQVEVEYAAPFLYAHVSTDALRHLCAVASGLDSMVLGETEVLGQVAEAHSESHTSGAGGPILDAAFRTAMRAGRRARAETGIGRRATSVASEAVRLVGDHVPAFAKGVVVVVGSGQTARIVTKVLRDAGARDLRVVGRSFDAAHDVSAMCGAIAVPWHGLIDSIREADVVIGATGAPHAVITAELVSAARRGDTGGRPLLCVDLAVPRDIEPEVGSLPHVTLYDLDVIQSRVVSNIGARDAEVPHVRAIIAEEIDQFETWRRSANVRPALAALHVHAEKIRQRELERALRHAAPGDRTRRSDLDMFSRALVSKLLDAPSRRLRGETNPERLAALADAVAALCDPAPCSTGAKHG